MSSQKRTILFLVLSITLMLGIQFVMEKLGLNPPPRKPEPAAANAPEVGKPAETKAIDQPAEKTPGKEAVAEKKSEPKVEKPKRPEPALAKANELILGSVASADPKNYHLDLILDQRGAGVDQIGSALYKGETIDGVPDPKTHLHLIRESLGATPPAFSITLRTSGDGNTPSVEIPLDLKLWEVVRDKPDASAIRSVTKKSSSGDTVEGQEISFRYLVEDLGLTAIKTFRIWKGEDGFEFDLGFEGTKDTRFSYRIFGPHGIPIEGEAWTSNFRDVFFAQYDAGRNKVITRSASDVVKAGDNQEVFQSLPIRYLGVENQYFAVLMQPWPMPTSDADRRDRESSAFIARKDEKNSAKSDVGVELTSLPIAVGPNVRVNHSFRVYAGPKTAAALAPYEAEDLASYRKYQLITIPLASELAKYVIAPLLDRIYGLTKQVAQLVGLKNGNYGIAIILLTMTVRLCMFPISRKQALIAKKMQDLQPQLMAIKEKYKDDKEAQTRETLAFYKKTGFNPAAGCLPALIQMPIFVGLWQALNNSVPLRHSTFLYIKNLAAPDMLFKFPMAIPFLGDYFNLLPIFVVGLMLVQTKLFTPPPATEEAKMQQSMMKYMMLFMMVMFYRVPSGLGIYFITSSGWQICERLLLPKIAARHASKVKEEEVDPSVTSIVNASTSSEDKGNGQGGWLTRKLEKLLEDAEKQRTIRNNPGSTGTEEAERSTDRPRGNRPKPPGGGKRR